MFRQARELGAVQLGFSGGEPLVRQDLAELIAAARGLGYYTNLITSGIGLTEVSAVGDSVDNEVSGLETPFMRPEFDVSLAFNPHSTLVPVARVEGLGFTLLGASPGDSIMAYVSADHGLVVHRVNCANVREFRKHPDRCVAVSWAPITQGMFPVSIRIDARNTPGVLASISTSIGQAGSNIETVSQPESNPEVSTLLFTISVHDRDQMATVLRRLRRNPNVLRVHRVI